MALSSNTTIAFICENENEMGFKYSIMFRHFNFNSTPTHPSLNESLHYWETFITISDLINVNAGKIVIWWYANRIA